MRANPSPSSSPTNIHPKYAMTSTLSSGATVTKQRVEHRRQIRFAGTAQQISRIKSRQLSPRHRIQRSSRQRTIVLGSLSRLLI
ncbi:hypothetical protein RB5872 [Rhodopirellula baltica SH 1]|uniref:Uncharacterized protein n=1 Tax=Rhodopirellula baltica (strain DSM 10527 / NCIMB 13988 / SH1) TaxID=243090 RepID=Q7UR60_RHOBA|nr:hypothetical protein RB5872 [Rhodopirellula baltica SH 1]